MAGTAVLKASNYSPDKNGFEIQQAVLGAGDTTVEITPSQIKWIDYVTVTPMSAASAAADVPYLTSFASGATKVTITGANSTQYLVKIEGKIS